MTFEWYRSQPNDPKYPPSLASIPPDLALGPEKIFDIPALTDAQLIAARSDDAPLRLAPVNCHSMKEVEEFVRQLHRDHSFPHMYRAPNISLRDDWFTDAVFGQQTLTGTNPTIIARASNHWIETFKAAATSPEARTLLTNHPDSFFVVDYSYIHEALGVLPVDGIPARVEPYRVTAYGGASVTLFRLEPEAGRMHPFAIILDYRDLFPHENVFIFNRRLTSSSPGDESSDWPWRYAKTATQVANWLGHEVGVHLVGTHLVTEVCLVAAHITFAREPDHLVFQLLKPHRDVTFPVNALARGILVPNVIIPAAGFPKGTVSKFLNSSFKNFDWKGSYVPANLRARGFPIESLGEPKFRNCGWARGVAGMWKITREFVSTVLGTQYPAGDAQVAGDTLIRAFCDEMRGAEKGRFTSFPETIETLDDLIDAVTNIIHIATTQHTSINYLQQYYMTFVPNLPGALYTPLPTSAGALANYTEQDLLKALPIREECKFEWLLMGQVTYLLSFTPPLERSIFLYAVETARPGHGTPEAIRSAAETLRDNLTQFAREVVGISNAMEQQHRPYLVLDPTATTSSIIL